MPAAAKISAVAHHLPARRVSTGELEAGLRDASPGWRVPAGYVERLTGVRWRHVAEPGDNASDLAAEAAEKLLAAAGLTPGDIDLLIFASASQDMMEPATAHMVADRLGVGCAVMDVKDACNSFLQGLGVADAFVQVGRHRRVLVVTGETPSRAVRWMLRSWEQFIESIPGYTLSDGGAAALVEPAGSSAADQATGSGPLIELVRFGATSSAWRVGTLPGGGSANPHDPDAAYFRFDSRHLRTAFEAAGPGLFLDGLAELGLTWDDVTLACVHQVAVGHTDAVAGACGIPERLLERTVAEHGNLASASLPLQLSRAVQTGRVVPGDRVAMLGLAGGISLGLMVLRW